MAHHPFRRLQSDLTDLIASLPPESRLPSEPALAHQLRVSRATLREAMRSFEGQGLIRRRQGVGTFVVGQVPVIDSGLELLESIEKLAQRIGLAVSVGELQIEELSAGEDCAMALGISVGLQVTRISRVIYTDSHPVAYLVDTLPSDVLSVDELHDNFSGSVLDLLLRRGAPSLAYSRTDINAIGASPEVARKLQVQRDDVLLHFIGSLYTTFGRVVDYSFSYFLPGYFRFHVVRRVG